MSRIKDVIWELAEPIVEKNGCEIWDVEYLKEAGTWYLRLYIDKEAGVSIEDCEKISREMDPVLDEKDPISESYVFEVSSAGAERELKRPSDFEKFMGENVEVKLYSPVDGRKSVTGRLVGYEAGSVTVETGQNLQKFEKSQIALVRLRIL
jgi:ribosome maturation factor RimP